VKQTFSPRRTLAGEKVLVFQALAARDLRASSGLASIAAPAAARRTRPRFSAIIALKNKKPITKNIPRAIKPKIRIGMYHLASSLLRKRTSRCDAHHYPRNKFPTGLLQSRL